MRIAITGSAGTGKSTLSAALAERLSLSWVPEGMREYLVRTGIDLHVLGREGLEQLVRGLWAERREQEAAPAFVSDRCSIDFAAFWLFYRFEESPDTNEMQRDFEACAARYDRVIVLPFGGIPLERDGIRSTNAWTQLHFQLLLEGMLSRTIPPERLLHLPPALQSLPERLEWVLERMSGSGLVGIEGSDGPRRPPTF